MGNKPEPLTATAPFSASTFPALSQGNFWKRPEGPFGGLIQGMAVDIMGTTLSGMLNGGVARSTD